MLIHEEVFKNMWNECFGILNMEVCVNTSLGSNGLIVDVPFNFDDLFLFFQLSIFTLKVR